MVTRAEMEFRREVARAFRDEMKKRHLSVVAAASELGVSRQSLHKYLACSATPRSSLVSRACLRWNLSMNVYGKTFTAGAFAAPGASGTSTPAQLTFPEILQSLRDRDLEVRLVRVRGDALELKLSIKFAS